MLQKSVQKMNTEVCEQCGKCTSACPVSKEIEDFNPRKLVSQIALGKIDEVIAGEAIWTCTTCLKCKERCPEEISPYDIILILRNLAYREGLNYPVGYDDFIKGIMERGFINPPQQVRTRGGERVNRINLGLPEVSSPLRMNVFRANLEDLIKAGRSQ
jgi:heterodisulfide reductase subunit C